MKHTYPWLFVLLGIFGAAGQASAAIQLTSPATGLGFGKVRVGDTTASQQLTFTNTGSTAQTLGKAVIDGNLATCAALGCPSIAATDFQLYDGQDTCSGKTLAPAQNCTLQVGFVPLSGGAKIARLAFPLAEGGAAETMLSGTGLYQPGDCVFDWAEKSFPLHYPGPANSFYVGAFYARCYNGQTTCIGVDGVYPSFAAARGYIYDGREIQPVGTLQDLAKTAGCL